jgi:uncharacterized protein
MTTTVANDAAGGRFIAYVDGEEAGSAFYTVEDGVITFTHTEVDDAFEGKGVGGELARFGLDDARSRGRRVVAQCPFIAGWIERHPDYADLTR